MERREVDSFKLEIVENYTSSKLDLTEYVKSIGMKMTGNTMSCPFHGSDSTPSLKINGSKWKCFGCGRGGGYLRFRLELAILDNSEAKYYDVVEAVVKENKELSAEVGGTIYKTKEESASEKWEKLQDFIKSEPYKPKRIEVKSVAMLINKATKLDTESKLRFLSGLQDELPYNVMEAIVTGSDLTGMSLADLAVLE